MDDFDPRLRGRMAGEQIGDLYMRMRGLEEALMAVVDAVHRINPEALAPARTVARLGYQGARDRNRMPNQHDQSMLLRYLAQRLHVLETPEERTVQRPFQTD